MQKNTDKLSLIANSIRMLGVEAIEKTGTGHIGTLLGASDMVASLFSNFLNFSPKNPNWINRDRFILSAGHSCAMLYSTLHLLGYEKFTLEAFKNFRQLGYITHGHPEINHLAGIEITTGPLGEGVSMAVGIAIGERNLNAKYPDIINHFTVALVGEGCLMEGVSYEALSLAGHLGLSNLVVIYDKNDITIDGTSNISFSENINQRMESLGFNVLEINGHCFEEINNALETIKNDLSKNSKKPTFLISNTKIGYGCKDIEGKPKAHGAPIGKEALDNLKETLNWQYEAFEIPQQIRDLWQKITLEKEKNYNSWQEKFNINEKKEEINQLVNKDFLDINKNNNLKNDIIELAQSFITNKKDLATRVASGKILEILQKNNSAFIGGSADLSSSNNTKNKHSKDISKEDYSGNYINYGIREHAMGAIMNGLACYGNGFIPYGGTFLIFSDFLRPAIRLAALMETQVFYILTHDSISLGADGPTHQPVEHIPSLRLIPNLEVLRPCDIIETIESYLLALENKNKPTAIVLGRNSVPMIREDFNVRNNKVSLGAYIIKESSNDSINIISSGSELHIALEVANLLEKEDNIKAKVISVPSLERFKKQSKDYQKTIIGNRKNIIIETSILSGWKDVFGENTLLYGMDSFGASGTTEDVMKYFGFTSQKISQYIKENI